MVLTEMVDDGEEIVIAEHVFQWKGGRAFGSQIPGSDPIRAALANQS